MRTTFTSAIFVGLALATSAVVSCSSEPNNGGTTVEAEPGTIGLKLTVGPGVTINTIWYTITGPTVRAGNIDVTNSQSVSAVIGGLAAGGGYVIQLSATSAADELTCLGTAAFTVVARTTSVVNVALTCKRRPSPGSLLVNGVLNACPIIDSVSAAAPVTRVIQVSSSASDDGVPAALSYAWSISAGGTGAGTLSSATAQNPTVSCTTAGSVNLSLTVSDGDNANCVATDRTFTTAVSCPAPIVIVDPFPCGNSTCAACETQRCPESTSPCDAFTGVDKTNCYAVLTCVRDSSCHTNDPVDCYCGNADSTQCFAGGANGVCRGVIEVGQGTTDPTTIRDQYIDPTKPAGAALELVLCDRVVCSTTCIPYGTSCPVP